MADSAMTPAVSVIMPAFRAAATAPAAVASVQAQTRPDWELILALDGSEDEAMATRTALESMAAADPRIRLLGGVGQRSGAGATRNRAIAAARGRYLAFLDADDTWLPIKLTRQLEFMEAREAAFSFTAYRRMREGQGIPGEAEGRVVRVPDRIDHAGLLRGNVVGALTVMLDRDRIEPLMGSIAMPEIPMRQDFALWLKILRHVPLAHGLDEVLAMHVRRPGSLSSGFVRPSLWTWRMLRREEGLGPIAASAATLSHLAGRLIWRR